MNAVEPAVDDVISCHTCRGRSRIATVTAGAVHTVGPIECGTPFSRVGAIGTGGVVHCAWCTGHDVERIGRAVFTPTGVRIVRRR